jgi:tetratricopeptide (TPR) repeat protein
MRARTRAVSSQHEEACRALRAALKLEPSNRDYAAALAASQRAAGVAAAAAPRADAKARGDAAMARRDWDAACAAYTAALAAAPRDGAACAAALCLAANCVLICASYRFLFGSFSVFFQQLSC